MKDIKGKVVVVSGASGNLGSAICKVFAGKGAIIIALDLSEESLLDLRDEIKNDIDTFKCDITDFEACQNVFTEIIEKYKRIDVLINNAGITNIERYAKMKNRVAVTRKVMEVNFFGAVHCLELCFEQLIKHKGAIVNISSVAGFAPLLGRTAYSASKHAMNGFFTSLSSELIDSDVQCLIVCPSFIEATKKNMNSSLYQEKKKIGQDVSPIKIAEDIISALKKKKRILISGKTGLVSYYVNRLLPNFYFKKMREKLSKSL